MAKIQTAFRINEDLLSAIDEACVLEGRDRTSLVEAAVGEWLRGHYPGLWAKAFPDLAAKRQKYITDYKDQQ